MWGERFFDCRRCGGKGKIPCQKCGGTGEYPSPSKEELHKREKVKTEALERANAKRREEEAQRKLVKDCNLYLERELGEKRCVFAECPASGKIHPGQNRSAWQRTLGVSRGANGELVVQTRCDGCAGFHFFNYRWIEEWKKGKRKKSKGKRTRAEPSGGDLRAPRGVRAGHE